jgi:hypothetical protein
MDSLIRIQAVEPEGDDGLIVTFSDGTTTAYVTEELLALRPHREPINLYADTARRILTHIEMSSEIPPPVKDHP